MDREDDRFDQGIAIVRLCRSPPPPSLRKLILHKLELFQNKYFQQQIPCLDPPFREEEKIEEADVFKTGVEYPVDAQSKDGE